jgi:N-acetylglucosaminyl-diphospho-decaprenol L-rhamnosyltransferase
VRLGAPIVSAQTTPPTVPRTAVIIVNYNSSAEARRAAESAAADLAGTDFEVLVVDNASSDDPAAALGALPHTRLIANPRNVGFGAAVNQAARLTDAALLWLLNPDCVVEPGACATLRRALDRHPDCAIAAPQLLNTDGTTQASARGEPDAWTGLFGRHSLLTKFFPSSAAARRNLPAADIVSSGVESAVVDWVMGAAMLVRRERFDDVGGFDERYFMYWEDADLCRRLRDRGWSTRYVPAARIAHVGGVSAGRAGARAVWAFHQSAYRYYATHVVTSAWHPLRWLARVGLTVRAIARMLTSR